MTQIPEQHVEQNKVALNRDGISGNSPDFGFMVGICACRDTYPFNCYSYNLGRSDIAERIDRI